MLRRLWQTARPHITLHILFASAVAVALALLPLIIPKVAVWPVFGLAIITAVVSAILIVRNEQRLRTIPKNRSVLIDDATLAHLKELRGQFLKLQECREALVGKAMEADWRAYLNYFEGNPTVRDLLQKYEEDAHWTVIQGQLRLRLTNPLLDELKKSSRTWQRLRKISLALGTEIGDTELNRRIDAYLRQSDGGDAQRIQSALTAKYAPLYRLPIEQQPIFSSPRANRAIREMEDILYHGVQERITELLQPQSSQIGSET